MGPLTLGSHTTTPNTHTHNPMELILMAKRTTVFAFSPIRALMRSLGAEVVSKDAIETLIEHLEAKTKEITNKALELTRHSKRKKINKADIQLVLTM